MTHNAAPAEHTREKQTRRTARDARTGGPSFRGAVTLGTLIDLTLTPEVLLLGLLFTARSIGLLFGSRGSGKSWLGMLIAYAVASGKKLDPWGTGQGVAVCYLDGEMRARGFRERLEQLHAFDTDEKTRELARSNLHIISRDLVGDTIGSIDTEEGQEAIDALLPKDVRLIVIDNLSAWTEGGAESIQAWQGVKRWLIRKRLDGIAVLIVHHAGKSGVQRGTSAHEDLLDYAIQVAPALDQASDPSETCFTVEHTKWAAPDSPDTLNGNMCSGEGNGFKEAIHRRIQTRGGPAGDHAR